MKRYNVALIGCGNNSHMHLDAYQAHSDRIRVVAACDPIAEHVNGVCQQYGIEQGFSSLEEMIAQSQWDVAVVCTPTHIRTQVVDMLASAGKHIFVEKPFADSYADAQHMVKVCSHAHVKLAINQNFRYHYPFELARDLVQKGKIGKVVSIVHQDLMFRQDVGWRTQLKRHAMAVMGVHWFDGFRRILNDEPESLMCETRSSAAIDCIGETEAVVTVNFQQGALVSYVESFSSPTRHTETWVLGEEGSIVLNYHETRLYDLEHRTTPRQHWENPYRGTNKPEATFMSLSNLLTALEQGDEIPNNGEDNLKTIALLDGAYRSAEERRTVTFQEGRPVRNLVFPNQH
jgi:D-apiose dehydrogenase